MRTKSRRPPTSKAPWYSLDYTFVMEAGEAKLPRAPISGKTTVETKAPALAK